MLKWQLLIWTTEWVELIFKWHERFREDRENIKTDSRSDRSVDAKLHNLAKSLMDVCICSYWIYTLTNRNRRWPHFCCNDTTQIWTEDRKLWVLSKTAPNLSNCFIAFLNIWLEAKDEKISKECATITDRCLTLASRINTKSYNVAQRPATSFPREMTTMLVISILPGPLGQSDAPSEWYSGGQWFDPRVRPHVSRRDFAMTKILQPFSPYRRFK